MHIMDYLNPLRYVLRVFSKERRPRQLAMGAALGLAIGLVPKGNLIAVVLTMLLLGLKVNLGTGLIMAFGVTCVGPSVDRLSHGIGMRAFQTPWLHDALSSAYQWPVVPWTSLNNSVVLGSVLLSLLLFYPTFHFTEATALIVQPVWRRWRQRHAPPADAAPAEATGVATENHATAAATAPATAATAAASATTLANTAATAGSSHTAPLRDAALPGTATLTNDDGDTFEPQSTLAARALDTRFGAVAQAPSPSADSRALAAVAVAGSAVSSAVASGAHADCAAALNGALPREPGELSDTEAVIARLRAASRADQPTSGLSATAWTPREFSPAAPTNDLAATQRDTQERRSLAETLLEPQEHDDAHAAEVGDEPHDEPAPQLQTWAPLEVGERVFQRTDADHQRVLDVIERLRSGQLSSPTAAREPAAAAPVVSAPVSPRPLEKPTLAETLTRAASSGPSFDDTDDLRTEPVSAAATPRPTAPRLTPVVLADEQRTILPYSQLLAARRASSSPVDPVVQFLDLLSSASSGTAREDVAPRPTTDATLPNVEHGPLRTAAAGDDRAA